MDPKHTAIESSLILRGVGGRAVTAMTKMIAGTAKGDKF